MSDQLIRASLRGVTAEMLAHQVSCEALVEALVLKGYVLSERARICVNPEGLTAVHTAFMNECYWQPRVSLVAPWMENACGTPKPKGVRPFPDRPWCKCRSFTERSCPG